MGPVKGEGDGEILAQPGEGVTEGRAFSLPTRVSIPHHSGTVMVAKTVQPEESAEPVAVLEEEPHIYVM